MRITEIFKILSDDNRLRIISLLYNTQLCVCELEYITGIEQSNLSKHLSRMYLSGILSMEKKSQWSYYSLSESFLVDFPFINILLRDELSMLPYVKTDYTALEEYLKAKIGCEGIKKIKKGGKACRKKKQV